MYGIIGGMKEPEHVTEKTTIRLSKEYREYIRMIMSRYRFNSMSDAIRYAIWETARNTTTLDRDRQ